MKKNFFLPALSLMALMIVIGSCSKHKADEQIKVDEETLTSVESRSPCGPGEYFVVVFEFNGFNFHRPKMGCAEGFWFCEFHATAGFCVPKLPEPDFGRQDKNGIVRVWGRQIGDEFEMHFPIDLKSAPGFTDEDLQVFSVDEPLDVAPKGEEPIILQTGQYKTTFTDQEIIARPKFVPGGAILSARASH
jgi:hypothetical protein